MAASGVVVVAALACVLAGWSGWSGGRSAQSQVTIRFWNVFTGPDGRTILSLVKRFNERNPDIHVLMQRMDWGTYYNKVFVAGLGGRAPEIFVVHSAVLPRFNRAELLRPLDDLIASGGIDPSDVDANVWEYACFDGRQMAIPLDVHPLGLYYNKELLRQAGIVDGEGNASPPANREEFVNALRKLRKGDQYGLIFTWLRTNAYAIMKQFGGEMFTADLSRCTLDDGANVRALEFCVELMKEDLIARPQSMDSWIGFRQGKVGMVFEGVYMLSDLRRQGNLPYAGAPMPLLGDRAATWGDSHSLCLRRDLAGRELRAAWRFICFLSDNSLDWADGGQVPVRKSLRDTDRFRAMSVQSQFARQLPYVQYLPRVPFIFEFQAEFDVAVERALRLSMTPGESLAAATRRLNTILERDRRMYRKGGGER